MARGGVAKSYLLLLRRGKRTGSGVGKLSASIECGEEKCTVRTTKSSGKEVAVCSSCACSWIPHPRTGIYFPTGHEWVMEDVPEGAATFAQTCWFRNVDGVDVDVDNPNLHACSSPSPSTSVQN